MEQKTVIRFSGVTKVYYLYKSSKQRLIGTLFRKHKNCKKKLAVNNLSFEIKRGEKEILQMESKLCLMGRFISISDSLDIIENILILVHKHAKQEAYIMLCFLVLMEVVLKYLQLGIRNFCELIQRLLVFLLFLM